MSMSSNCQEGTALDPHKRVCYSRGLVLGVDEFVQEELYFLEQNRVHHRSLHGYGTVSGLDVQIRDGADGPEVFVAPGMAIDPAGRSIHIQEARCASLNRYLAGREDASPPLASGTLRLCLTLEYRCCKTDLVPIPSGPCRTEDDNRVASRIADAFVLRLVDELERPEALEARAVRRFGDLLRSIEVNAAEAPTLDLDGLLDRVRALAGGATPEPESPPQLLRINPTSVEPYFRAGFQVWVQEVRPTLVPEDAVAEHYPVEEQLLLACLEIPVTEAGGEIVVDGNAASVGVDESERPFLLHTQLLQELLMGGLAGEQTPQLDHSLLSNLDADDHSQYLQVADRAGSPPASTDRLLRELSAGGNRLTDVPPGAAAGQPLVFGQTAGGDLSGNYPNPAVNQLNGVPLSGAAPAPGEVLTFLSGPARWEAAPLPPPEPQPLPDLNFEEGLVRIVALSWTHGRNQPFDPADFEVDGLEVNGVRMRGLVIAFGRKRGELAEINVGRDSANNNSVAIWLDIAHERGQGVYERLRFDASIVPVTILALNGDRISKVEVLDRDTAPGIALLFDRDSETGLPIFIEEHIAKGSLQRMVVEALGEHIRDAETGRAIDAEFARGRLPTGDRPEGAELGLQGGRFLSWLVFERRDFRLVNAADLAAAVPGLGLTRAERVIEMRDAGEVRTFADLRRINGVGDAFVKDIARTFRLGDQ